ncbi:BZ3500_MvSof-1268-A1-R1_Chr4-3g07344 [Microbotryum saponariae]|uniref:BZ3500_MvSof-1268-A1-R1_Chr4-3g07344 protein n=1 Tax=Microbotryum saponariae TaxID=289078 RepID=A0A2X0KU23_9BASI|nr:BZ3500_MvSof-1268-A1-R1_Chr4-3g07344 [Microbotryum saponariae]SDA07007.1 BZ3501_MvSof-1269-A2-R1_Chr4-2g07053 [Microbotryum saponariae]
MSSFSSTELLSSLSEIQSYSGIQSYTVLPAHFCSSANESRAEIKLLEKGDTALIVCSDKGWGIALRSVVDWKRLPPDSAAKDTETFETLENLLAYLSPAFEARRMQVLSDKLSAVRMERGEEKKEEGKRGAR